MAVQAAQDARLASACHLQGGIDAWKKASGPLERLIMPSLESGADMTQFTVSEAAPAAAIFWHAGSTGAHCCAPAAACGVCGAAAVHGNRGDRPLRGHGSRLHRSAHARAGTKVHGEAPPDWQIQPVRHCGRRDRRRRRAVQGLAQGVLGQPRGLDPAAQHQEGHRDHHRDCGAAKIAYGEAAVATKDAETETHRKALAEFRKQVNEKQPKLGVETGLMAINGKFERLG